MQLVGELGGKHRVSGEDVAWYVLVTLGIHVLYDIPPVRGRRCLAGLDRGLVAATRPVNDAAKASDPHGRTIRHCLVEEDVALVAQPTAGPCQANAMIACTGCGNWRRSGSHKLANSVAAAERLEGADAQTTGLVLEVELSNAKGCGHLWLRSQWRGLILRPRLNCTPCLIKVHRLQRHSRWKGWGGARSAQHLYCPPTCRSQQHGQGRRRPHDCSTRPFPAI